VPRIVGAWTRDKLQILSYYLPGYLGATTRAIERVYIDAFAGPGTNQVERTAEVFDGSPLIALKARAQNGTRFSRLFFIENERSAIAELSEHLAVLDTDNRCEIVPGDVNIALPEVVRRINRRSPTFVFLDTEGIEPSWSTIEAIAPWQVEFLINFPLGMSINRNPDSTKTIDYFGTEECRALLQRTGTGRDRALLDLYKGRLAELGFIHTTEHDRLVRTINNQRLYYLIFVSKVNPASRIMNWVLRQPDSRGQARFDL
jgi:three-Cys-motif partner protein